MLLSVMLGACTQNFLETPGVEDRAADHILKADTEAMRVLRVELALAVVAYVGSERLQRAEESASIKAQVLLSGIQRVQGSVARAAEAAKTSGPFEIVMKEVVDELFVLTKIAVDFDLDVVGSLSSVASAGTVEKLRFLAGVLRSAARIARTTKDIFQDIDRLKKQIGDSPKPKAADWEYVERWVKFACARLGKMADLPGAPDSYEQFCKYKGEKVG
ncbi:MAG: hypothetical protein A3J27_13970 [Candidatus Tectomicrobia bacterium RIFCSPLOWO2_12_FULL_69_37]|nr:MAG: hypothetical protein A3J27_13970 [Candidatus Tectomicrobia bacterium RIFCSPLOWO2_12_FULL_69_37]